MAIRRLLVVLVLCMTVFGGATLGVAAQEQGRNAELRIDQPAYADGDVGQTTVNGTTQYRVQASPIEIQPANFDADDVVNAGTATEGGQLNYDREMGEYEFAANAAGTYELFWVIEETYIVNTSTANATNGTNATNTTETATRQVRYTALIRVSGATDVQAISADRLSRLENQAGKWSEFNATVQDLRNREFLFRPDGRTTDETIEGMVTAYITTSSPFAALSGNFTSVLIIIGTTIGGALFGLLIFGYNAFSVGKLREKLNRYREQEAQEGDLADRQAQQAAAQRVATAAGTDLQDIDQIDDYWADQLGEAHGPNMRAAWESIVNQCYGQIIVDYLAVMTQNGHSVIADGDEAVVVEGDRDDAIPPHELDEIQLQSINVDEEPVSTFDVATAAIDWEKLPDEDVTTLDLEQWAAEWNLDLEHDADLATYGEMLVALTEAVENHEFTDEEGKIRPNRAYLEALLDGAYTAEQYKLPGATMLRDLLERALRQHSPSERVHQTVEEIKSGRYDAGED